MFGLFLRSNFRFLLLEQVSLPLFVSSPAGRFPGVEFLGQAAGSQGTTAVLYEKSALIHKVPKGSPRGERKKYTAEDSFTDG